MAAVELNQSATIQDADDAERDIPRLSKSRSAMTSCVRQASCSPTVAVHKHDGFLTKERLSHCCTCLNCFFALSFLWVTKFISGAWHICSVKIKTVKLLLKSLEAFLEILYRWKFFPLFGNYTCYKTITVGRFWLYSEKDFLAWKANCKSSNCDLHWSLFLATPAR